MIINIYEVFFIFVHLQATKKKIEFSESQMRVLKSHFATNRNPSADELMNIATKIEGRLSRVKV